MIVVIIIAKNEAEKALVNHNNPITGPIVMGEQSPIIKMIFCSQEVVGSIVDGRSCVYVINKFTSDRT